MGQLGELVVEIRGRPLPVDELKEPLDARDSKPPFKPLARLAEPGGDAQFQGFVEMASDELVVLLEGTERSGLSILSSTPEPVENSPHQSETKLLRRLKLVSDEVAQRVIPGLL